jgi:oligopeptide/dipeptide ABC transporter ATP-binding protein
MAVLGLFLVGAAVLAATLAPLLAPEDPRVPRLVTAAEVYAPPGAGHLLGTDDAGKDVLSTFLFAARVSLLVGFLASLISILVGGAVGLFAGYCGGRVEGVLMRFTDVMLVIPDLPLAVVVVALTRPSLVNVILVIGLLGWTGTARLVRSQTLSIRERRFVARARALGAGHGHVVRRHVLPLVLPLIVANTVLVLALAIVNESTLSFLGLSDPTALSWGQSLNFAFGRGAMSAGAWWALIVPGCGIVWVVAGCTLLGRGLEEVFNPRLATHHLAIVERDRELDPVTPPDARPDPPLLGACRRTCFGQRGCIPVAAGKAPERCRIEGRCGERGERSRRTPGAAAARMGFSDRLLEVRGLSVDFLAPDRPPVHAVSEVSFALPAGRVLGIVGESGCGKTTLGLSLIGLLPAAGRVTAGQVLLDGRDLLRLPEHELAVIRWREIAVVFQGAMNAFNPVLSIGRQIGEAVARRFPEADRAELDRRAGELLETVGIAAGRGRQYPHQFSGGMRQRAMIAMALAALPRLLIADEPTTALDVVVQAQILALLGELRSRLGLAVALITHDLGVVAEICDEVLVIYGGLVVEHGAVEAIFRDPRHPYTRALLQASPDLTRPGRRLTSIPGTPPPLDLLPPGCRFAGRCPDELPRCRSEAPVLHLLAPSRGVRCHLQEPG